MEMICLNCQHIAHENDFIENMSHCPVCNDETVTEIDYLAEARDLIDQNALAVSQLEARSKARWAKLRAASKC